MKRCSRCLAEKSRGEFYRRSSAKDGLTSQCKECTDVAVAAYKAQHPDQGRKASRDWQYRNVYGLESETVDALKAQQQGLCMICRLEKPLQVDHDHRTKEVRALLCGECNRGLGLFGDDPVRLKRASVYAGFFAYPVPLNVTDLAMDLLRSVQGTEIVINEHFVEAIHTAILERVNGKS